MQTEFIPVTGDTHELQFKKSPAQKWFLGVYNRTSAPLLDAQKSFSNDSQGMYVLGPDGTSYGYTNDHDPSNIFACMDGALKKYKANPPKQVAISDGEINSRFAIAPKPTTSVIRVYSRIRPVPKGCTMLNQGIGRDYLWIYEDEIRKMLAWKPTSGAPFKLPADLAMRVARYHLLDNVRGTPDMWNSSEVKRMDLKAGVIQDTPIARTISFDGSFLMRTASGQKGYEGKIEGQLEIDVHSLKVSRFRAISSGKAWGNGTYTPNAPKGRFPLTVAMVEATDNVARIVPPEAVSTENSDAKYHYP